MGLRSAIRKALRVCTCSSGKPKRKEQQLCDSDILGPSSAKVALHFWTKLRTVLVRLIVIIQNFWFIPNSSACWGSISLVLGLVHHGYKLLKTGGKRWNLRTLDPGTLTAARIAKLGQLTISDGLRKLLQHYKVAGALVPGCSQCISVHKVHLRPPSNTVYLATQQSNEV
jgi:hypothetical protein